MNHVYGYVRVSTDKQAMSPEVQRDTIERTATRLGYGVDAYFQDAPVQNKDGSWSDAISGKVPLPKRPAGEALCDRLKKGDVLIIAKIDRAFRNLSDCVIMLDRWERLGVSLVLCDFPMLGDMSNPFGKAMIQLVAIFAEIERKLISQRIREALALRKRKGHANGKYPGYGFRWQKQWSRERMRHVKVKVACPEERAVMREIVMRRMAGESFEHIQMTFVARGELTKDQTPWSLNRCKRAYFAELRLMAIENNPPGKDAA